MEIVDNGSSMELEDLRLLHEELAEYKLETRFLEVLWFEYSSDQCACYMTVEESTIKQFKIWLESGNPEDAYR